MKAASIFNSVVVACTAAALSFFTTPAMGHMAMGYPPTQGGPGPGRTTAKDVHSWIGFRFNNQPPKPFPCGGYAAGPVTTMKAGDVVKVRFWNPDLGADYDKFPPRKGIPSARHGGGACEFALSYDGGKKWWVIGQYTKTCPDLYYEWPVLIPKNIRECTDPKLCLFSWSWVAHRIGQFYHHCSNVIIQGAPAPAGLVPTLPMTVVDVKALGQSDDTTADGDNKDNTSTGPLPDEIQKNTSGFFEPGSKGLDLLLKGAGAGGAGKGTED
ncbi:hypothetical protein B0O80DRAFT_444932 [Mortierella sp. GBAus27b]|nr:hypothetical protein B0O80DRAFT_444932 [Mortierella sp. GBAus27b]